MKWFIGRATSPRMREREGEESVGEGERVMIRCQKRIRTGRWYGEF
jgi:hypothetical protein